eukprot:CAMPEP_0170208714 /NCGR_PEP_ID=MMETSP0116_2-20130129/3943_1 /TAXON_ID=400756 /ORGANISM="Durinskia baltica, Strain CSIRO CS-38" /LENGTH=353 /DNA_ID=CAMNT_0010459189 /DNA_START=106 /DNA_END=1164 /DNA_ORIENTATION=+
MRKLATGSPFTLTTLMIRNLPKKITEWDVAAELCEAIPGVAFDFVYMPQGAYGTCAGFAFVNFSDIAAARAAHVRLEGHLWARATGELRPLSVKIAHVQGFAQNLRHLKRGEMHKPGFRPPLVFVGGNQIPFELALEVFVPEAPSCVASTSPSRSGAHLVKPLSLPSHPVEVAGTVLDHNGGAFGDTDSEASTASSARGAGAPCGGAILHVHEIWFASMGMSSRVFKACSAHALRTLDSGGTGVVAFSCAPRRSLRAPTEKSAGHRTRAGSYAAPRSGAPRSQTVVATSSGPPSELDSSHAAQTGPPMAFRAFLHSEWLRRFCVRLGPMFADIFRPVAACAGRAELNIVIFSR